MIINEELFVLEDQCKRLVNCIIESHTMSEYMKTKKTDGAIGKSCEVKS